MGSLQLDVEIDGQLFNLKFYIIPKGSLGFQAILGSNIFKQATVQIGEDGIIVKSKRKADVDSWLMNIAIDDDEDRIDVEHIENALVKNKVGELIRNYTPNKTEDVDIKMKIILRNDEPVYQRARRLSEPERLEVDKQIAEWLKEGIVRESSSDFASPIVLVSKKDGTKRLCCDYRKLNKNIVKDRFPLPLIEDVMDRLEGAEYFTTIDLKNGFFHVDVEEESVKYTAFITPTVNTNF